MADTSRSQVTITLGRSGQVVKRAGSFLDIDLSNPLPAVGSKRSVRDRLGSSVDTLQLGNKRLRGDGGGWHLKTSNGIQDFHLSKDDLRFKIMKQTQSNDRQNIVDLRDMLSQRARLSTANPVVPHKLNELQHGRPRAPELSSEMSNERKCLPEPRNNPRHMPEPRNERPRMLEPRDGKQLQDERQRLPHPRDDRRRFLDSRDDRQRMDELRDGRQCMPDPLEVRQRIPKLHDVRQRIPEPEPINGSMSLQFTSLRTSEAPSQIDVIRNNYSPWTLDHIRRKSPDRVLNGSRGLSPPQRTEEPQRRPIKSYEDSRTVPYVNRDIREVSRSMNTTSFLAKPSLSAGPTKSGGTLVAPPLLPPGSNLQRSQYTVEEHVSVEGFLRSLGLEKYLISFKVEEVDMAALSQMGDHDLKELGVPMGPRKKILLALVARTRRRQAP